MRFCVLSQTCVLQEQVEFGYGTKAERWAGTIVDDEDTGYGGLPPGTEVKRLTTGEKLDMYTSKHILGASKTKVCQCTVRVQFIACVLLRREK